MNKFDTKYPFGKYKIVPRYREGICKVYVGYMLDIAKLGDRKVEICNCNSGVDN